MIGGAGEKKTLRLVARYADACNLFARPDTGPAAVKAKLDVLAAHCAREGTDYHRIRKTILWTGPLETTAAGGMAFADQMRGYAEVGIDEVHVMPFTADPVAFVDGLGNHVVPQLSALWLVIPGFPAPAGPDAPWLARHRPPRLACEDRGYLEPVRRRGTVGRASAAELITAVHRWRRAKTAQQQRHHDVEVGLDGRIGPLGGVRG